MRAVDHYSFVVASPYVAAALSIVCPIFSIDDLVNSFVLFFVRLVCGDIDTADDDRVFARAVKLMRMQRYLSLIHRRLTFPFAGGVLFPPSFYRLFSRISSVIRPYERCCPAPLEYPGDYVSFEEAILEDCDEAEIHNVRKHLNRVASNYEGRFRLVHKIEQFDKQYKELIQSNASHVLVNQHQHQSQSQWIVGIALSTTVYATFKLLESVNFNVDTLVDLGIGKVKDAIASAGSLIDNLISLVNSVRGPGPSNGAGDLSAPPKPGTNKGKATPQR